MKKIKLIIIAFIIFNYKKNYGSNNNNNRYQFHFKEKKFLFPMSGFFVGSIGIFWIIKNYKKPYAAHIGIASFFLTWESLKQMRKTAISKKEISINKENI